MATPPTTVNLPHAREPVDIEAWTETATAALGDLSISRPRSSGVRGTSVTIDIPLDDHDTPTKKPTVAASGNEEQNAPARPTTPRRREPIRRDSLKRREALLRGKEGSRRRQRWENGRLLGNPYMEPPLPSDWEVRPTHPQYAVPYFLATRWDDAMARQYTERQQNRATTQQRRRAQPTTAEAAPGVTVNVPKDVREKLKRARGAKGLLQDLEEQVRSFVSSWDERHEKQAAGEERVDKGGGVGGISDAASDDSDLDEVVFVGRNGEMHDLSRRTTLQASAEGINDEAVLAREKLVFDSLETDHGASFGRWLVHSLGLYYGLKTWSITTGDPARREAYVGINESRLKAGRSKPPPALPRPLYGLV